MSEKWKQKILLIFPFAVLAAGMMLTTAFFLHTYRQIAFEHTSALCETILANSPEVEPQLLAALKDYHSLTDHDRFQNSHSFSVHLSINTQKLHVALQNVNADIPKHV